MDESASSKNCNAIEEKYRGMIIGNSCIGLAWINAKNNASNAQRKGPIQVNPVPWRRSKVLHCNCDTCKECQHGRIELRCFRDGIRQRRSKQQQCIESLTQNEGYEKSLLHSTYRPSKHQGSENHHEHRRDCRENTRIFHALVLNRFDCNVVQVLRSRSR
jgi:hypothetical protein